MCKADECIVGTIATKPIAMKDWGNAVIAFEKVIEDFNIRGQRQQIPHPGFLITHNYCPVCGTELKPNGEE